MADLRFDALAETYGAVRPSYPDTVYDGICAAGGVERFGVAADVGCGAGASLKGLARIADRIIGIEPAPRMRAIAAEKYPNAAMRDGTGMETGLEDASVDLITVATAFHWFERQRALEEFHRILRPGGVFAPYHYDFPVIDGPANAVLTQHLSRRWDDHYAEQLRRIYETEDLLRTSGLYERVGNTKLPYSITHTAESFAAFAASFSFTSAYMETLDDPAAYLKAFADEMGEAQPGEFEVAFDIELVTGRKPG